MSALFSPLRLRSLELANRIVVSPMCQYSAENGSATDWHLVHLGHLALAGPGLVFTEATAVSAEGRISARDLGLYDGENERALERVFAFLRRWTPVKVGVQLAHAGRKASTLPPWEGGRPLTAGAWETFAPSALAYAGDWPAPSELDAAGLHKVVDDFVAATRRCERLNVDAIELHFAHGYLLHEFLSPLSNQRTDRYGGSLEARMCFPLELFEAVRTTWPQERPLGVRISATDHAPGGWTLEDSVLLARELRARGCDFIDCSSGGVVPYQRIDVHSAYQVPYAARVKRRAGIPTIAVGKIENPELAEAIVANAQADLVALARGFLRDPRFPWDAANRLGGDTFVPPQYERARKRPPTGGLHKG